MNAENQQQPIPADYDATGHVLVHSIFKTIQGEGPFCGESAMFIRLFGCNLRCPGCDTEYTANQQRLSPSELLSEVQIRDWPHGALIVITGGEPFRQNIVPAVYDLLTAGYRVQVETNGILWPDGLDRLLGFTRFSIVCSPKTNRIHPRVYERALAFKYVLRAGEVGLEDGLPLRALKHTATPHVARPRPGALVFVQPMDEGDPDANEANVQAAIMSTMLFGHRLQIQVHKSIGME